MAPPPRSARLTRYESEEVNGFVFAYHGRESDAPSWRIPKLPDTGSSRAITRLRLHAHPQTTSENSVDRAHLGYLHGYRRLEQTTPTVIDGPVLSSAYAFTRRMLTRGLGRFELTVEISIKVWGLGVSTVDIRGHDGFAARQWVLATPVDGDEIDMWLAMDMQSLPRWRWLGGPLARLARPLAARLVLNELKLEVQKDAEVWARQHYQPAPVLSAADRDMMQFRRYCEQFYAPVEVAPVEEAGRG